MKKKDVVTIGPSLVVILSRRVAMIRGVGEVWATDTGKFVTCTTDIRGHTSWSLVAALWQLHGHYGTLGLWEWEPGPGICPPSLACGGGVIYIKPDGGKDFKHIGNVIKMTLDEWPGK